MVWATKRRPETRVRRPKISAGLTTFSPATAGLANAAGGGAATSQGSYNANVSSREHNDECNIMTSVTVHLSPETAQWLQQQASLRGESLEAYIRHLAENEVRANAELKDMLNQGLEWLTHRRVSEMQAARDRILATSSPLREVPAGKSVVDMVEGKWPGAETDGEIRDALDRIS
jgi:hypothetical protein